MFEFDSEQVRYEHRFGPFGSVNTPPPVPFEQVSINPIIEKVHDLQQAFW